MTFLYNCRHNGDQYRITKFDDFMNVESSYTCTTSECDCPAGVRPTCRHREMLPKFLQRQHVGDEWFYDYDRGGWVQMGEEWAQPKEEFIGGMSQQVATTFVYTTDEPPLPITHVQLNVSEPKPAPEGEFMKRRFL
jgi:hypothetical protein